MATNDSNPLENWYANSIGRPSTADEVYGYWTFVVGVVAGFLGITLVMISNSPGENIRGAGIALAALGLILLLTGPSIRLPLKRSAKMLSYAGAVIGIVAVVWFALAFNAGNWGAAFANNESLIIGVYGLGVLVIAAGSVFSPLLMSPREEQAAAEKRAGKAEAERDAASEAVTHQKEETAAAKGRAGKAAMERGAAKDRATRQEEETAAAEDRAGDAAAERDAAKDKIARQQDAAIERQIESEELTRIKESQSQFELYTDSGGKHRWRLRHDNGNIVADSAQGYASRQGAQQGLSAVKRDAFGGAVMVIDESQAEEDEEAGEQEAMANGGTSAAKNADDESKATFETYQDVEGKHRGRLRHDNDNIIADGGQGYASAASRDSAVERIRQYSQSADYLHIDPASFEVYRDEGGDYRWRLLHMNGQILAHSARGYTSRQGAKEALEGVQKNVGTDGNAEVEIYEDDGGEFRFRLVHQNGNIIATGLGHPSQSGAADSAELVGQYAAEAHVLDIGSAAFEIYEDEGEEWRWRLRHRNGNIMADSSQGYERRTGAEDGLNSVKQNAPEAEMEPAP